MAEVVVSAILVVVIVYGREVLMPLALAAVIAFMLSPLVAWIARRGVPRAVAILFALTAFIAVALSATAVFSSQVLGLTESLASYKGNLAEKVSSLSPGTGGGAFKQARDSLEALQREVERQTRVGPQNDVIEVAVRDQKASGLQGLLESLRSVLGPAEMALLTLVYVAVLLAGQYDLVDRLVRLAGVENMTGSTAALSTAGSRLSSYFVGQGTINLAFGVITGAALALMGIPNAILWGMATAVLRFIPFIGIFIAALPPLVLAAAVSPGWGLLLGVLSFYLLAELLTTNVIEPVAMGRHVGLSPLAFIAAGSFWWVVWGPVGLLLAAPITTTLVVLGEFFPSLAFLTLLFGDRPPLTPAQEYYHRLLAGDPATASDILESEGEGRQITEIGDEVVLPALAIAARDFRDRRISSARAEEIANTMQEVTETLSPANSGSDIEAARTIVVPGHGAIDAAAGAFVAAVLARTTGTPCESVQRSSGLLALASLKAEEHSQPETLVLATVGGLASAQTRHMARRANMLFRESRIVLFDQEVEDARPAIEENGAVLRTTSLGRLDQILRLANAPATPVEKKS